MLLVLEIYIFELLKSCNIMSTQICSPFGHIFKTWWYSTKNCNVKSNSFHDKCCFHPILVTWFLVVFGNEVTKILRNSLFIFANGKHRTENHATKVTKKQKRSYQNM